MNAQLNKRMIIRRVKQGSQRAAYNILFCSMIMSAWFVKKASKWWLQQSYTIQTCNKQYMVFKCQKVNLDEACLYRIFEELQSRILEVTETLITLLLHLPDLQKLLELAEAWRRKGGRAKGGAALAEYMLKSLSKEVWQHQLCYALALHRRRTHLEALVAAVKAATSSFRQKMQSGYFDTASVQPTRTPYGGEGNLGAHPASAREVLQNLGYAALHFWGDR